MTVGGAVGAASSVAKKKARSLHVTLLDKSQVKIWSYNHRFELHSDLFVRFENKGLVWGICG